jgi:acyl-CoA thioester hydrolase
VSEAVRTQIDAEVRYAETDAMGIVHHAVYLVWFELARTRLCTETGFHYAEIERGGHYLTVTSADVRYRRPARYGDRVSIHSWVDRLGSRGLRFGYEVVSNDVLLATGSTQHVWIDSTGRPCRMPERYRPAFTRLAPGTGGDA